MINISVIQPSRTTVVVLVVVVVTAVGQSVGN